MVCYEQIIIYNYSLGAFWYLWRKIISSFPAAQILNCLLLTMMYFHFVALCDRRYRRLRLLACSF